MQILKMLICLLSLISLNACKNSGSITTVLNFDKDLVPEGIAIDSKSGKLFLNSLHKNKIVTSELDGKNPTRFIESGQHGYLSGFGMTIKGDTLYALSNNVNKAGNKSVLLLLNIKTNQLLAKYEKDNPVYAYLNDMTISSNNEIYITDSESNKIYKIQRPAQTMEIFLDDEELAHSNGISISEDNSKLYLASGYGIRVVDIQSKKILNQRNRDYAGIDGMKFYKNTLIGIVEHGVFRYHLNENGTEVISKKELIKFDSTFRSPTTFDLVDNTMYFIKNTQLDNFDETTNQMKDLNKLESLILLRYQIE